jgi:hypothetical protein
MYLTSTFKRTLIIGGASLLAVVALIGWTRDISRPGPDAATAIPSPNWYAASAGVARDPEARVVYAPSPFGSEIIPETPEKRVLPVQTAPSPSRKSRVVVKKRPFKHSAAIVGGSAAAGAAIGALAGGGKGAAIGALAGGGGGLVYDRLTHKKKVVQ